MNDLPLMHETTPRRSRAALRLRTLAGTALLGQAGWLGAGAPAVAANADLSVTVEAIPTTVSVSRLPNPTNYAAYKVTITNNAGNTSNQVTFSGDSLVVGSSPQQTAGFVETRPAGICTGTLGQAHIECNIGHLPAGSVSSFVVLYKAPPISNAITYADPARIDFTWVFGYSNGGSPTTPQSFFCDGQPATPPCTRTEATNLITTATTAINSGFFTYLPSFEASFFTGSTGSALPALPGDPSPTTTTKLTVPAGQNLGTAKVDQSIDTAGGLTGDTLTTITTLVQVPNNGQLFSQFATIELRRDASTIKVNRIDRAKVLYAHDDVSFDANGLPACPASGDPSGFTPPVCIASRTAYTKKTAPTPDDVGDWLFVIHALENGGFRF